MADKFTDGTGSVNADWLNMVDHTVSEIISLPISVKSYGAIGDGVTDDTIAIQQAIDFASTFSIPKTVLLPAGNYLVTSELLVARDYLYIEGEGFHNTKITRNHAIGNTLTFSEGGGTNIVFYGGVKGIQFVSTVKMTDSVHLKLDVCRVFKVSDCSFIDGWVGIHVISCGDLIIENCYIRTGTLYPTGGGEAFAYVYFDTDITAAIPNNGGFINNCNFRSSGDTNSHSTYGVRIASADGLWFNNVHVGNTESANFYFFPKDNTTQLSGVNLENCWLDRTSGGRGVFFDGETTAVYGYHAIYDTFITGGTTSINGITCLPNAGTVDNLLIKDCLIVNQIQTALSIHDCINLSITGCDIRNVGSGGAHHGIVIGPGCVNYRIQNNSCGFKTDGTTISSAINGMNLAGTGALVTGNDVRGNTASGIVATAVTGASLIKDNLTGTTLPSVASAATIAPPSSGDMFTVTGTTNITSITASWAEREIVIIFSGILTLTDGSNLNLSGNFTTSANDTIKLVCDGTNWFEVSRSVN